MTFFLFVLLAPLAGAGVWLGKISFEILGIHTTWPQYLAYLGVAVSAVLCFKVIELVVKG